jgi:hypothetical protein
MPSINHITVVDSRGNVVDTFTANVGSNGVSVTNNGTHVREYYESQGATVTWNGLTGPGQQSTTIVLPDPSQPASSRQPSTSTSSTSSQSTSSSRSSASTSSRSRSCSSRYSSYTPPPPPPPARPRLEEFNVPRPTFTSDLQRVTKFSYFFGIDELNFKRRELNEVCCHITKNILIGNSEELELDVSYSAKEHASVEFYIVDDQKEYPILPIGDDMVKNEKIFFKMPLRFKMDTNKPFTIKKDGEVVNISVEEAMNANDGLYTIDYHPIDGHSHVPTNNVVRLKTILRLYDKDAEPPYVKSAALRGYGGEALWSDRV